MARVPGPRRRDIALAGPFRSIVERQATPLKLERISAETRQEIARNGTDVRRFGDERVKWEAPAAAPPAARPAGGREQPVTPTHETKKEAAVTERTAPHNAPREVRVTQPERVRIPAPPIVGRRAPEPGSAKGTLPPRPADERKQQGEQGKGKQKAKND